MLAWCPLEVGRYCDPSESILFHEDLRFLANAVFEEGSEPGVGPAGDVDGCCGDEVVPVALLVGVDIERLVTAYHEVSVPAQCQKKISTNTTTAKKCAALKNS